MRDILEDGDHCAAFMDTDEPAAAAAPPPRHVSWAPSVQDHPAPQPAQSAAISTIPRLLNAGIDDLWRAVGVHRNDGIRVARTAAKQLSRVTHPDKCNHPQATEAQKILSVALSAFKDDQSLREHERAREESRKSDAQAAEQARAFQARARATSREARGNEPSSRNQRRNQKRKQQRGAGAV